MLDECIFDYITKDAGLFALIGTRLYPDFFRQNEPLLAVAYSLEDDQSYETQAGPSALRRALYRFDIWAGTAAAADGVRMEKVQRA